MKFNLDFWQPNYSKCHMFVNGLYFAVNFVVMVLLNYNFCKTYRFHFKTHVEFTFSNLPFIVILQVLQESLQVPGTDVYLVYHSSETSGYMSTIMIQLTPDNIPDTLAVVRLKVSASDVYGLVIVTELHWWCFILSLSLLLHRSIFHEIYRLLSKVWFMRKYLKQIQG